MENKIGDNESKEKISEDIPILIQISNRYRLYVDSMYGKLYSNLDSWSHTYWLVFYGLIPAIILLIGLLSTVMPNEVFIEFFIQKQGNLISISSYLSNFSHRNITHISANLILYLISITIIFLFDDNRKRLKICSFLFFTLIPIIGAFLTEVIWNLVHAISGQNYGFSAISIAFFGYALYVMTKWIYVNAILDFSFNCSEQEIFQSIFESLKMRKQSAQKFIKNIFFIFEFLLFSLMISYIVRFGIQSGVYIQSEIGISNGIGHFQGFMLGLICPTFYGIIIEKKERILDALFIVLIFYGIWIYYNNYLTISLFS